VHSFYHLTLFNNAHIDTNLHTHGLHVSGVGTVDDVTRVAKPGECLTYDVSSSFSGLIMKNLILIDKENEPAHRKFEFSLMFLPFFTFHYLAQYNNTT
jgi:hypothetical protein